jgi:hypothetical protein
MRDKLSTTAAVDAAATSSAHLKLDVLANGHLHTASPQVPVMPLQLRCFCDIPGAQRGLVAHHLEALAILNL